MSRYFVILISVIVFGCSTVETDQRLQAQRVSPHVDETILQGERVIGKDSVQLMTDSLHEIDDTRLLLAHFVATQELEYRLPDAETQHYLDFIRKKLNTFDRPGVARLESVFHDLSDQEVAVYWAVIYREMVIRNTPLMKEFVR